MIIIQPTLATHCANLWTRTDSQGLSKVYYHAQRYDNRKPTLDILPSKRVHLSKPDTISTQADYSLGF